MPISVEKQMHNDAWVIKLGGKMTAVDSLDLHAKLLPVVPEDPQLIIFDMSDVELMPSLGIGTMMSFTRALEAKGNTVRFACLNDNMAEMIKRCRLDSVWDMYGTLAEAEKGR
ncbi:MAG: STAS domain-containing protein [Planctomycetota bacterium]